MRVKNQNYFIILAFTILSLVNTSCSTDDDSVPKLLDKSLQDEYFSSFSVELRNSPVPISKIVKGTYTKPRSNYGMTPYIDFRVNADNTIDVFCLDNLGNKSISKISLDTKSLVKEIIIPTKVNNQKRFLGFESLGDGKYIIGYSKDNAHGDKEAEAWYTAFDETGTELFSTRIWGENNLNEVNSKGKPTQAGSGLIRYSKKNNFIVLYLSHTMKWGDGVRHQAGWLGFLNSNTGEILKKENGNIIGNGWFFSHNFDQRGIISSQNTFYALAHGDAYPRALGISNWSHVNGKKSSFNYYDIKNGKTGNNTTLSTTGDLTELSNGNVAVVYSTQDARNKRDLRVSIVEGLETKTPVLMQEKWLSSLASEHVGWGSKVIQYDNEHIIIGWNTFDGNNNGTGSHFLLTNMDGTKASETYSLEQTVLYPAQSFKKSADGKYIIFVSEENSNIKVHLIAIK